MAPQKAYTNSTQSGRLRRTRSSIRTPTRRRALPVRLTWACTSRYVTRRPSDTSAVRSPRPSATCRSMKWAAALKFRGRVAYGSGRSVMLQLGLERHLARLGLPTGGLQSVVVPRLHLARVEVEARTTQRLAGVQDVQLHRAGRHA